MATYDFKTKSMLTAVGTIAATDIISIKQGSAEDVRATIAQLATFITAPGLGRSMALPLAFL